MKPSPQEPRNLRTWASLLRYALIPAVAVLFIGPSLWTDRSLLPGNLLFLTVPLDGTGPSNALENAALSDVLEQFFPYLQYLRTEILEGRFPLWNPYVLGGTPFLANTVSAVFFPLNWLVLAVPVSQFFEWSALLKLLLGAAGMFAFCRKIGIATSPSLFASATFMYSGYMVYFLLFPNTWVAALFGWILLSCERLVERVTGPRIAWLSVLTGLSLFSGHVESGILLMAAAGLYVLFRSWRRLGWTVGALLLGLALAAATVVPFVEFLANSTTFQLRSAFTRNPYFLSPELLPALVIPYFPGSPVGVIDPGSNLFTGCLFIGAVPVFFALLAGFAKRLRFVIPLLALVLFGLAVLFGIPPFFDLFTAFPPLRQGNHMHVVQILQGALAVLAAIGLGSALDAACSAPRRFYLIAFTVLFFSGAAAWLSLDPSASSDAAQSSYFFFNGRYSLPLYPLWSLLLLGVILISCRHRNLEDLALVSVLANGIVFGMHFNPTSNPGETVEAEPSFVHLLRQFPHERAAAIGVGLFPPNYPMRWKIRDLRGYESVVPVKTPIRAEELPVREGDAHHFLTHLDTGVVEGLRRTGTSLLIATHRTETPGLTLIHDGFPQVYRVEDSHRVAWEAASVPSVEVDALPLAEPYPSAPEQRPGSQDPAGGITWVSDEPDRVVLQVLTPVEQWLILRDTFFPGWRAYIDDRETPILATGGAYRSVQVPAGEHQVSFEYRPFSFLAGVSVSLVALGLTAALLGSAFRRSPRSRIDR